MQFHIITPTMAEQVDQFGLIMFVALEVRTAYSTALTMGWIVYPLFVLMDVMLELNVLVSHYLSAILDLGL